MKGFITFKGGEFWITTNNESVRQKTYLVSVNTQPKVVDRKKEYDFEIIPNNSESDEQVEYIARITNF